MVDPLKMLRDVVTGSVRQRTYWELRSRWRPIEAIIGTPDESIFLESAKSGVALMERLGLLAECRRSLGIGAGGGRVEYWLAKRVPVCCGVDISLGMARLARRKVPDRNAHFFVGSGHDLAFLRDGGMDLVYSFIVFQHVGDEAVRKYFVETARVLRAGGSFLFQIVACNRGARRFVPFRERHPYAIRWRRVEDICLWLDRAGLMTPRTLRENGEELSLRQAMESEDESLLFLATKPCSCEEHLNASTRLIS